MTDSNTELVPLDGGLLEWAMQHLDVPADQAAILEAGLVRFNAYRNDIEQWVSLALALTPLLRSACDLAMVTRGPALKRALTGYYAKIAETHVAMNATVDRIRANLGPVAAQPYDEALPPLNDLVNRVQAGITAAVYGGDDGDLLVSVAATLSPRLAELAGLRPNKVGRARPSVLSEFIVAEARSVKDTGKKWPQVALILCKRWSDKKGIAAEALNRLKFNRQAEERSAVEMGRILMRTDRYLSKKSQK